MNSYFLSRLGSSTLHSVHFDVKSCSSNFNLLSCTYASCMFVPFTLSVWTMQVSFSESSILSSLVKPLVQSTTNPVVLLHGFDRFHIHKRYHCLQKNFYILSVEFHYILYPVLVQNGDIPSHYSRRLVWRLGLLIFLGGVSLIQVSLIFHISENLNEPVI